MKKIVLGSFIAVISLLVASSAVSIAWYASQDVLKIESFELGVSVSNELYIGLTPNKESFKKRLEYSELKSVEKFSPVSSMCSSKWMDKKDQNPTFYGSYDYGKMKFVENKERGYAYVEPQEVASTSGFYTQEMYLYSESNYIAVLDASSFFIADEAKNIPYAKQLHKEHPEMGTEEEILAQLNSLVDSARISILTTNDGNNDYYSYRIVDPTRNNDVYLGGVMDSDLKGVYDYWTTSTEHKQYEILYGDINDRSLIKYKFNENIELNSNERTWYDAGHADNTNIIDFEASEGLKIKKENAYSLSETQDLITKIKDGTGITQEEQDGLVLIPLTAYVPTRIVLSIYFEAWDKDNINCTMGGSFKSEISFGVIDRHALVL